MSGCFRTADAGDDVDVAIVEDAGGAIDREIDKR